MGDGDVGDDFGLGAEGGYEEGPHGRCLSGDLESVGGESCGCGGGGCEDMVKEGWVSYNSGDEDADDTLIRLRHCQVRFVSHSCMR